MCFNHSRGKPSKIPNQKIYLRIYLPTLAPLMTLLLLETDITTNPPCPALDSFPPFNRPPYVGIHQGYFLLRVSSPRCSIQTRDSPELSCASPRCEKLTCGYQNHALTGLNLWYMYFRKKKNLNKLKYINMSSIMWYSFSYDFGFYSFLF